MPRTTVSRSKYQELAEENKKLLSNLEFICCNDNSEAAKLRQQWRDFFKQKNVTAELIEKSKRLDNVLQNAITDRRPILHLNLVTEYFNMILARRKTEEYREITPYWKRFFDAYSGRIKVKGRWYKPSDIVICFSNGYSKNRRQMFVECKQLNQDWGVENWGAKPETDYFVLTLGNILSYVNC